MKFDLSVLNKYVNEKLISKQKHPNLDLWIYNYTPECVFSKKWDDITGQCRGLILDSNGNIVARPFRKFFNYGEREDPLPNGIPKIYKKLDGSLIIVTFYEEELIVATRGSFISDQSQAARKILFNNQNNKILFWSGITYLFEYTSPQNRIVIAYPEEKLTLLAVIRNFDGYEVNPDIFRQCSIEVVEEYKAEWNENTIKYLQELNTQNEEGFVLKWDNAFRIKLKFADYFRLHKLITGLNEKTIWEFLKDGKPIDELIKQVPGEFEKWVIEITHELENEYGRVFNECTGIIWENDLQSDTRKDAAIFIIENYKQYQSVLFPLLDNKESLAMQNIWKLIKPKSNQYFKEISTEDV